MQTFVPEYGYAACAQSLDFRRLGKQRVEGLQILNTLTGVSTGWINHPAIKMWRGCESGLAAYTIAMCNEWKARGYKDTCADKVRGLITPELVYPSWWGTKAVHDSHRSNLIRKLPEFYFQLWPQVAADLPYEWPVHDELVLA